jgi:hypothetical protein
MGFVLKSTFWLGLVYSAMPFDETGMTQSLLSPAEQASACAIASAAISREIGSSADPYRALATLGCASLAGQGFSASPSLPAPRQSLNATDRRAPWLGPPLPPARPRSG